MRLIDAEALIDVINSKCESDCENDELCDICFWGEVKEQINKIPTVDPVKHGKWLYAEDYKDIGEIMESLRKHRRDPLEAWIDTFYCSECCCQINAKDNCDVDGFTYCPYCGAKMDGVRTPSDGCAATSLTEGGLEGDDE